MLEAHPPQPKPIHAPAIPHERPLRGAKATASLHRSPQADLFASHRVVRRTERTERTELSTFHKHPSTAENTNHPHPPPAVSGTSLPTPSSSLLNADAMILCTSSRKSSKKV